MDERNAAFAGDVVEPDRTCRLPGLAEGLLPADARSTVNVRVRRQTPADSVASSADLAATGDPFTASGVEEAGRRWAKKSVDQTRDGRGCAHGRSDRDKPNPSRLRISILSFSSRPELPVPRIVGFQGDGRFQRGGGAVAVV